MKMQFIIIESDFSKIVDRVTAFQEYFELWMLENFSIGKNICDTCLNWFFWVGSLGIILLSSPLHAPLFAFYCSASNVSFLVLLSLDEWKNKNPYDFNKAWGPMFPPELL